MGGAIGRMHPGGIASAAGGIAGEALNAVSTSVGSVAHGIEGLTNAGVGAARSAFEKALPAIQNLPGGILGGLSPLAGLPGPAQFLGPVADAAGKGIIQKVAEHLQNPALDVSKHLQKLGDSFGDMASQPEFKSQQTNTQFNNMMNTLTRAVKQTQDVQTSILRHMGA